MNKQSILICIALFCVAMTEAGWAQPKMLVFVRHAEKMEDGTSNPSLSEKGKQRAVAIQMLLEDVKVDQLWSTDYHRTRQTIQPLADYFQIPIESYNPANLKSALDTILQQNDGKVSVICGHSNTIPIMINMLIGERRYANLEEDEYDKIWVLYPQPEGSPIITLLNMPCP